MLHFFLQPWSIFLRRDFAVALCVILPTALAAAQQIAPPALPLASSASPTAAQPAEQMVYYAGPGVAAPELLPVTVTDLATGHCKKLDGTVILSVIVDANGVPRNVYFLRARGDDLDRMALNLVTTERFRPGTHNGAPSATVDSIEVNLEACIEDEKNEAGLKVRALRLKSVPNQKLRLQEPPSEDATSTLSSTSQSRPVERDIVPYKAGEGISAPVIFHTEIARFTDEARRAKYQGVCLISLIVDEHGMPQNVHVIRALGMGLDNKAVEAVREYRFKPAMKKDGTPVPTIITIEINFRLY